MAVPSPSPALNEALVHGGCFLTSLFSCDVIFNNPITAFGTCIVYTWYTNFHWQVVPTHPGAILATTDPAHLGH